MKPLRSAAVVLLLAGCHSIAQPGSHAIAEARKEPPRPIEDAGAETSAVSTTEKPLRWGKLPEATGELFTAVEGRCAELRVSVIPNATFVHYAGRSLARVSGDAFENVSTKFEAERVTTIQRIEGRWPDSTWLSYEEGGRCTFAARALRFSETAAAWKPGFMIGEDQGVVAVQPYLSGALGLRDCSSCSYLMASCKERTFVGSGDVKVPPMTGDGFMVSEYGTLPSGEVFAVGVVCKDGSPCSGQLRWWTPGGKVGWDVIGPLTDPRLGHLIVRSKTDVIVTQGGYLGRFDGAQLNKLSAPGKDLGALFDAGPDGYWIVVNDDASGAPKKIVLRKPDGTDEDMTPPKPRPTSRRTELSMPAGVASGAPWTIAGDDIYKREGGSWRKVELPKPAFASSARSFFTPAKITVAAPDDVWVLAHYSEKQEIRTALLRTKRMKETYRCESPSELGGPAGGFASWPAPATDACKTPFLLLAPISTTSPKNFDYPQTRAVLGPKSALIVDGSIREIRENGNVWIGVVPRSVEDGRTLAALFAHHYPQSRSELLCAEATVTRTIPIASPKKD